jgi:hypothetical protein
LPFAKFKAGLSGSEEKSLTWTNRHFLLFYVFVFVLMQVEIPPSDLGATASLNETLSLLREVLSSHDASVVPLDARQGDYSKVYMYTGM